MTKDSLVIISHRGNLSGPNNIDENKPERIAKLLSVGIQCEIDLWYENHKFYLGHDSPKYEVSLEFLNQTGLWIHCKNVAALDKVIQAKINLSNYFFHNDDNCCLVKNKIIWTHPKANYNETTSPQIIVLPEQRLNFNLKTSNIYGICTDYFFKYFEELL